MAYSDGNIIIDLIMKLRTQPYIIHIRISFEKIGRQKHNRAEFN